MGIFNKLSGGGIRRHARRRNFRGVANYIVEKQYRDIEKERENWSFNASPTDMQTVFECARSTCLPNARVVVTSCLWLMYQQLSGYTGVCRLALQQRQYIGAIASDEPAAQVTKDSDEI